MLLIDDDPAVRRALGRLLGRVHDVIEVDGVQAALQELGRSPAFDAILCDVIMPESDRPDPWSAIVDRFPELRERIALVTGGAFDQPRRDAVAGSRLPTLGKPCSLDQLLQMVERLASSG